MDEENGIDNDNHNIIRSHKCYHNKGLCYLNNFSNICPQLPYI